MKYPLKFWLKISAVVALLAIVLGYGYLKTKDLIWGVRLEVEGIIDGQTIDNPVLELVGTARRAVKLSLNDRELFVTKSGQFEDTLLLTPGYNIITLKAKDRFGKEKKEVYQVIYY